MNYIMHFFNLNLLSYILFIALENLLWTIGSLNQPCRCSWFVLACSHFYPPACSRSSRESLKPQDITGHQTCDPGKCAAETGIHSLKWKAHSGNKGWLFPSLYSKLLPNEDLKTWFSSMVSVEAIPVAALYKFIRFIWGTSMFISWLVLSVNLNTINIQGHAGNDINSETASLWA